VQSTAEGLHTGPGAELPSALPLTDEPAEDVPKPGRRRPVNRTGRRGVDLTDRRRGPVTRGRRRGRTDWHAIVASSLAVLALVGVVIAVLIMATEPTMSRLKNDVGALTRQLGSTHGQLTALQSAMARSAAHSAGLTRNVRRLDRHVSGLQRTVHGLQASSTITHEETAGLRDCVPQLQNELAGLTVRTRSAHGRVTDVGLSDAELISPACESVLLGR
jgi:uncharacterized protein YoxC